LRRIELRSDNTFSGDDDTCSGDDNYAQLTDEEIEELIEEDHGWQRSRNRAQKYHREIKVR
jgi:hypothetical protein